MTIRYIAKKIGVDIKWAFWVVMISFLAGLLYGRIAHAFC